MHALDHAVRRILQSFALEELVDRFGSGLNRRAGVLRRVGGVLARLDSVRVRRLLQVPHIERR